MSGLLDGGFHLGFMTGACAVVAVVWCVAFLPGCAHLGPALAKLEDAREQTQKTAYELTRLVAWCDDQPAPKPEVCEPARRALDELARLEPYLAPVGLEVPGVEP